jgi:pimeloyl-ACP methyl ester carboxylesterase
MPSVTVNGIRLNVIDEGDGPPLVFLHGFPFDHSMWDAQRREFRNTHRVIIPDLRGLGRSEVSPVPVTMDLFADDVAALLDAVGVTEPVTLCGLSMGGCVAFAFVRRHAARLKGLILCDCRAIADTPEIVANRRKLAEKVLTDGPPVVVETMMPRLFGPTTNEKQPQVIDALRNVMLASSSRGIAAAQLALADRPDSTPTLAEIRVPTLVIVGEHDAISTAAEMQGIAAAIAGAKAVVIPGAGHMAPTEKPADVNRAIREWMPEGS